MKKILLLLLLMPNLVIAEIVLYCQGELSTGIIKKNGVWKTTNFNLERNTIKFNDDYTELDGLSHNPMSCSKPYGHIPDYIACVHSWGSHETFTYNTLTKRFLHSNISVRGYIDNGIDTENLSAGTCEAF
jgi:hypothetical protein